MDIISTLCLWQIVIILALCWLINHLSNKLEKANDRVVELGFEVRRWKSLYTLRKNGNAKD